MQRAVEEQPGYAEQVLAEVAADGPLTVSDLAEAGARRPGLWGWGPGKMVLHWLFVSGQVAVDHRDRSFRAAYDLPQRVDPTAQLRGTRHGARTGRRPSWPSERSGHRESARPRRSPTTIASRSGPWRPRSPGSRMRAGFAASTCVGGATRGGCWRTCRSRGSCADEPWWRPSIPWCGSAVAPSDCSGCDTASRCTSRRPSARTATTCCPSCWATSWWPGSTARRTAVPVCCRSGCVGPARRRPCSGRIRVGGRTAVAGPPHAGGRRRQPGPQRRPRPRTGRPRVRLPGVTRGLDP